MTMTLFGGLTQEFLKETVVFGGAHRTGPDGGGASLRGYDSGRRR